MKRIKVVYFGSSIYSGKCLIELMRVKNVEIIGVCSLKHRNKFNSDVKDLCKIVKKKNISHIYYNQKKKGEIYDWVKNRSPDFIFCIGWPMILNKKILNLAKYKTIGFHPTNIPNNRGRHPIIWSIILGIKYLFPTFFVMTDEVDFGPKISQKKIKINKNTNSTELYEGILKFSKYQIAEVVKRLHYLKKLDLENWKKKNFKNKGNLLRKRSFTDGLIDWRMNSLEILKLVNALCFPYTNADFRFNSKYFKVLKVKIGMKKALTK